MRAVIRGTTANPKYFLDGKEVTKEEFDLALPDQPLSGGDFGGSVSCNAWPILSTALAVHPLDRAEAEQDSVRKGVPTQFTEDGRAVLTDRTHRKRYLRACRFHDRSGGYGD